MVNNVAKITKVQLHSINYTLQQRILIFPLWAFKAKHNTYIITLGDTILTPWNKQKLSLPDISVRQNFHCQQAGCTESIECHKLKNLIH